MKIALLGYGKMGQVVEKIAKKRGHEIVFRKTSSNSFDGLENADVAIEFSVPNAAVKNIDLIPEYKIDLEVTGNTLKQ